MTGLRDRVVGLRMRALAQAMNAKSGKLDLVDVRELYQSMVAVLDPQEPLAQAIGEFCKQAPELRNDASGLAMAGHALLNAIERANIPTPPDLGRKDIHG